VRASRKLRGDELLITALAGTRLRMELDRVPLWRGNHVPIRQLCEDFARYLYLPRLVDTVVLRRAIEDGLGLLTWSSESFAYADSHDEASGRYRGLRAQRRVPIEDGDTGLLVRPDVAERQLQADSASAPAGQPGPAAGGAAAVSGVGTSARPAAGAASGAASAVPSGPRRFHGTVELDSARVGRDAGRIADEVVSHLVGLVGSRVRVTLEIEAEIPSGAPDQVVRTVTENSRTLRFTSQGFEEE
jgi:hypothetical protein